MVDTYVFDKENAELEFGGYDHMRMMQMEQAPWQYMPEQHKQQHAHRLKKKMKRPIEDHEHYIAIVYEPETGRFVERSSSGLKKIRHKMLADAGAQFSHYVATYVRNLEAGQSERLAASEAAFETLAREPEYSDNVAEHGQRTSKKRKSQDDADVSDHSSSARRIAAPQRSDDQDRREHNVKQVELRADDAAEWEKWFFDAFRAVQQVCCRVIAKEWIKAIHPKKQSTHPYNGKNPRTGEKGDSNSTKPPYWPKDVIHREPDHINKEARTKLLVHLLMNTPHNEMMVSGDTKVGKEINAQTLKDRLDQKAIDQRSDLRKKWSIIEDIIDVRTKLENFDEGGLPGDAIITTRSYSDWGRGSKHDEDDSDDEGDSKAELDTDEDGKMVTERPNTPDMSTASTSTTYASKTQSDPLLLIKPPSRQPSRMDRRVRHQHSQPQHSHMNPPPQQQPSQHHQEQQQPRESGMPSYVPGLHPPMIIDGWDSPTGMVSPEQGLAHTQMLQSPHSIHDGYMAGPWNGSINPNVDLASQFNDHMMVSPGSLPPSIGHQPPYLGEPFTPTSHPQYMNGTCNMGMQGPPVGDVRHRASLRMASPYHHNVYHGAVQQNTDEQIRQAYFG